MDENYYKMLKEISVRQDISEVKDYALKLADKQDNIGDGNTIRALLDYIDALEHDIEKMNKGKY